MGIKVTKEPMDFQALFERELKKYRNKLVAILQYVGEEVVNRIRTSDLSNWTDRTGNLRSSIGYVLYENGKPIRKSNFERVDGPDRKPEDADGSQEGLNYALSLAKNFPDGLALVVVAGMEYAEYVERIRNHTVLKRGGIEAKKLVQRMIIALNSKLAR